MCTHNQLSATLLQDSSAKQSACILWVFLDASAPLSVCLWPSLPSLCGTAGLIDNFICSWREEGDEYMTYPFSGMMEDGGWRGCFFFSKFPFFPLPGRTSGPLHARLVSNSDKWANFLKSIRSVIRKARCGGFFFAARELLHASQVVSFPPPQLFLLFSSVQMGPIVPGAAGWFSAYFGHDGKLLYQIWVMWTAAAQLP